MKYLISLFTIVVGVLLLLDLFFCVIAHGSGHRIPPKTDYTIALVGIGLLAMLGVLLRMKRKN
ncbi:LPXTG-motif cell wall-anchored protein [Chitinophaga dinghuensis]|uniref:LPXTG-motif cell wall-anchored protein n=1 Tax=Chitinophaga dinghuensis TaxID=1539050 RepID=A0A327VW78_9BACT|nr:LPXTG-motif cell wall-anchored protein [Chitinophaga dinghuensis]